MAVKRPARFPYSGIQRNSCEMGLQVNFWDMTYFTETASVAEVFIAVVSAIFLVFWGLLIWFYRRKGESPFRADAPKLFVYCAKGLP